MYVFIHCRYRTYSCISINNKHISKKESLLSNQSSNTCSTCYYTEIVAFEKEPEFEAIRCLWNKIWIFREYILKKNIKKTLVLEAIGFRLGRLLILHVNTTLQYLHSSAIDWRKTQFLYVSPATNSILSLFNN